METIRINGILIGVIDVGLSETLGLLQIIAPTRLSIKNTDVIEIGDFLNLIIIGKIKKVEEEWTGIFYQNDIWFDYMKKSDNEIPSFRCKFCKKDYEGKPNFQVKDSEDFVCDKCMVFCNYPIGTRPIIDSIPLDKDKIVKDSVKITVYQCAECKEFMDTPQFKTGYFDDTRHTCSLICAEKLKQKEKYGDISKYQKLKGDK